MRRSRLVSMGIPLLALFAHGCGSPPVQQSGVVADVRVVGGPPGIVTQPHIAVTLTATSTGLSESRQVVTGDESVTVRIDLPPGRYLLGEAFGADVPCSSQVVMVTTGPLVSANLSCSIR
jgi:hypothetical protein